MEGEGTIRNAECHHQNELCIKMGGDESRFNVLIHREWQSYKTASTNHTF